MAVVIRIDGTRRRLSLLCCSAAFWEMKMTLARLGLSVDQERLYRFLLRHPSGGLEQAGADLALKRVSVVAAELRAMGLLGPDLRPVAPTAAVHLLVQGRLERAWQDLAGLASVGDVLAELREEQRTGRRVHIVERLTDPAEFSRRVSTLLADAPGELAQVVALPRRAVGDNAEAAGFEPLSAYGPNSRTLLPAEAFDRSEELHQARVWHMQGHRHRVTTEPVRRLTVVNRQVAFVQAEPDDADAGVLQVRAAGIVAVIVATFDGMWDRALDVDDQPLSLIEHRVLDALTRHPTDAAAARALNISVRKLRTHIAAVMRHLHATTRFQAGLLARERGWL
ncbi:MAG: hypothetical protein HOV68_23330 [Streptomycetaceae bacterium]|nr:hypothetical protein [Streptomycetaceae bacterium]